MSRLVDYAKQHIESILKELKGQEDFLPFLTAECRDSDAQIYMGVCMPDEEEGKNAVADTMLAICAIHRATEAVFASMTWLVEGYAAQQGMRQGIRPSESMDRIEVAFLHHARNTEIGNVLHTAHTAPVIRRDNTVRIGEWSSYGKALSAGRFADAIRQGMDLGGRMPPDICAHIDSEIAAGHEDNLVKSMILALDSARKEWGD